MRILVLGGTVFLGRALTDAALAAGHGVTHFHRGKSSAPDARVETLNGDRAGNLDALAGRAWDAVIDTSGYLPQVVTRSVQALRATAGRYLFVSSISVYESFEREGIDEDWPVAPAPDPLPDTMTWDQYGALKAACEAVVREAFGEGSLIVRPGLIVGPHDTTDRFTWWTARVARGGRIAAPADPALPVQFIDVRDLAEWMVRLLERDASGTFNATSPPAAITMGEVLAECRDAAASDAVFEWIDAEFLEEHGVKAWIEMPLQAPASDPKMRGFAKVSVARALAAGLAFRPLSRTIADTLAWHRTRPADHEWKAGLAANREEELLAAWDRRHAERLQAPSAR
jgi:2'-hydroxyisoflavone reductase